MNYDELHAGGCLKDLPMRARLQATGTTRPSASNPAWVLEYQWKLKSDQPMLVGLALRLLNLGGTMCGALVGRAIVSGERNARDEDERSFVYLLNLAERDAWLAIDSWMTVGFMSARGGRRWMHGTSVSEADREVLKARDSEGQDLESDMLAGAIERLLEAGRLEAEVATQLDIKVPLYCAVIETPMMLKSLQTVDPEEWREHVEHYWNKGLNEEIWS